MSFNRLWLFLAISLPVLASLIAPMSTVDLAYQLRAGSEILATGAIPTVDTWTFTVAGQPWFDQQWGAQVILTVVERFGGWTGLAIFRALLVGGIVAVLVVIARRRGVTSRDSALLVLAAFVVMSPALALRPQLLGMACFALVMLLLAERRAHPARLWWILPLVVVWANVHGSFFLAPFVVTLAWVQDVHDRDPGSRRVLLVAVASAAVACITPFGPSVWGYAVGLSANPEVTARVTEWQPTSLRDVPGILFFASVAGVGVLIARGGRVVSWPVLAWLGVFVAIGLYAQRGVAWWPVAAVFAAAGTLIPARAEPVRPEPIMVRRVNAGLAVVMAIALIAAVPIWRPTDAGTGAPAGLLAHAPAGITAALAGIVRPGDRMLAPQTWGSWFEYRFPDVLQAVDSRIEIIPARVWRDYETVVTGRPGSVDVINAWEPSVIVLSTGSRQARSVLEQIGWESRLDDPDGVVMTRNDR